MHQSIPAVPIPPPGNRKGFVHVVSSGGGAFAILSRPGGWAFDTRVLESAVDEFIGKDEAFVEQWLVRQGLDKLVDVFKGMFSQFEIFLHSVLLTLLDKKI